MTPQVDVAASLVLVFESSPDWLPELQRELRECAVRAGDVLQLGDVASAALTLVDVRVLATEPRAWVTALSSTGRSGAIVVLAADSDRGSEWWLRDLGVTTVLNASLPRREILSQCRWLLRHHASTAGRIEG